VLCLHLCFLDPIFLLVSILIEIINCGLTYFKMGPREVPLAVVDLLLVSIFSLLFDNGYLVYVLSSLTVLYSLILTFYYK
jgi:hypothetical protein